MRSWTGEVRGRCRVMVRVASEYVSKKEGTARVLMVGRDGYEGKLVSSRTGGSVRPHGLTDWPSSHIWPRPASFPRTSRSKTSDVAQSRPMSPNRFSASFQCRSASWDGKLRWRIGGVPGGVGNADRGVLRPLVVKPAADTLYAQEETICSFNVGYNDGREWCE